MNLFGCLFDDAYEPAVFGTTLQISVQTVGVLLRQNCTALIRYFSEGTSSLLESAGSSISHSAHNVFRSSPGACFNMIVYLFGSPGLSFGNPWAPTPIKTK